MTYRPRFRYDSFVKDYGRHLGHFSNIEPQRRRKRCHLKASKTKTRDLAFRTFRSNDADPTIRKLTNYSNSKHK